MAKGVGMATFIQEDPPSNIRGIRSLLDAEKLLTDLQAHPGEGYVIAQGVSQGFASSNKAVKELKANGCQVRSWNAPETGGYKVWAKFEPATKGKAA